MAAFREAAIKKATMTMRENPTSTTGLVARIEEPKIGWNIKSLTPGGLKPSPLATKTSNAAPISRATYFPNRW